MKGRALLLVMLLLLATVAAVGPLNTGAEETRSSGLIRVRLYTQLSATDATLTTEQTTGTPGRTTDALDFISMDLEENLMVRTVDTGVGFNKGFEARLTVSTGVQGADVTVSIVDDSEVIAEREHSIPSLDSRGEWRMPLLDDADTFTFSRNSAITLRVEANRNVIIRSDEDSFLELYCENHLDITQETRDVDDRRVSVFYPNDLIENRHIIIEGDVENPFGATDVAGVNISIRQPNGQYVVEDQAANVGNDMNYSFDWAYTTGLPAGSYTINTTGRDLQGHEFSVVGSIIMAEYGVRIFAEDAVGGIISDSTTPGTPAKYTLTILNIGGKRADIVLDEGDPIALWQTSFTRKTFSLDAGDDEDITFDVKPSATLGGGNESRYTVLVTVNNDPTIPKSFDSIEVLTTVSNEVQLIVNPETTDPIEIGVSGTADYTFTVRNQGEFTTTVDLTKMWDGSVSIPEWSGEFIGSRITDDTIEDLRPMEIVDVTIRVNSADNSDVNRARILVTFQSREFPEEKIERSIDYNLVIGLVLTPTSPTDTSQDPGDSFIIYFEARNNDPNTDHDITLSVGQDNSNWPSSSFTVTPSTLVNIGADSRTNMGLEVDVPATANADRFEFEVKGIVDGNTDVFDTFDFSITINLRRELIVSLDPETDTVEINTKEESLIYLILDNQGNQVENVNITVELDSGDVEVKMNDAMTPIILNMPIQPDNSEQVKISFRAKDSAAPNQEITVRITVEMANDDTPVHPNDFKLVVKLSTSELFLAFIEWAVILVAILILMGVLLLMRPKKKRAVEEPPQEKEKDAAHGTVVRH
jgi:uncharacterized membrane protein